MWLTVSQLQGLLLTTRWLVYQVEIFRGNNVNIVRIVFYIVMVVLVGTGVWLLSPLGSSTDTGIDQSGICVVESDQDAIDCEEGSTILARFTDAEPSVAATRIINTAALYCDTNHQVTTTENGLLCVITHQRIPSR